jgi:parvulin-like peptidyl-prolyl isomerase
MNKRLLIAMIAVATFGANLNAEVLATVNGTNITNEDIDLIARQMTQGQKSFADIPEEYKQKIIEGAVTKTLLIQNALKSNVEKNSDFKKAMDAAKGDIALQVWQKLELDKITVDEKDAKAFYQSNIKSLTQPEQVSASHILVKTEEEAKKIIADLSKVSKADLAVKFADAAKNLSTGPSAPRGGDLGTFGKNQMVKEFSDAAFAMKAGEMTKAPVKTTFGYHIIYVAEKQDGGVVSFDEVKDQMFEGAKMQKFKESIDKRIEALTKQAKITYTKK